MIMSVRNKIAEGEFRSDANVTAENRFRFTYRASFASSSPTELPTESYGRKMTGVMSIGQMALKQQNNIRSAAGYCGYEYGVVSRLNDYTCRIGIRYRVK